MTCKHSDTEGHDSLVHLGGSTIGFVCPLVIQLGRQQTFCVFLYNDWDLLARLVQHGFPGQIGSTRGNKTLPATCSGPIFPSVPTTGVQIRGASQNRSCAQQSVFTHIPAATTKLEVAVFMLLPILLE